MTETPVPRLKVIQVTEMMSKCRKCHLRETKFAKFPGGGGGGAYLQIPLEACAFDAKKILPIQKGLESVHPPPLCPSPHPSQMYSTSASIFFLSGKFFSMAVLAIRIIFFSLYVCMQVS